MFSRLRFNFGYEIERKDRHTMEWTFCLRQVEAYSLGLQRLL